MKFIDRIKGLFNKNKRLETGENDENINNTKKKQMKVEKIKDDILVKKIGNHSYEINIGNDECVRVYNLKALSSVPHDNGESVIYDAQIICYKEGNGIYLSDYDDHIGFEVFANQSVRAVLKQFVTRYFEENTKDPQKSKYYLGSMKETSRQTIYGNYEPLYGDKEFKNLEQAYMKKIDTHEENEREGFLSRIDAREDIKQKAYEMEKMNKLERINRIRRLQNPTLIPVVQSDGMTLNYKGVNLSEGENEGNILILKQLEELTEGKEDLPYLYKAIIQNNISNVYRSNRIEEKVICFEIADRSLEQIINDANVDEIKAVLQLLSDSRVFLKKDIMRYVGKLEKIDDEFQIIRQEEPGTLENAQLVEQIKEDYKNSSEVEL